MTALPETSTRYENLLKTLNLALERSQSEFDLEKAVQECYGDQSDVFVNVLQSVLVVLHTQIMNQTKQYLIRNGVPEKLQKLQAVIAKLQHEKEQQQVAVARDCATAQQALQAAKLPSNITVPDYVRYQQYQRLMQEQERLVDVVAQLQSRVQTVQGQTEVARTAKRGQRDALATVASNLEQTADRCSMVSK